MERDTKPDPLWRCLSCPPTLWTDYRIEMWVQDWSRAREDESSLQHTQLSREQRFDSDTWMRFVYSSLQKQRSRSRSRTRSAKASFVVLMRSMNAMITWTWAVLRRGFFVGANAFRRNVSFSVHWIVSGRIQSFRNGSSSDVGIERRGLLLNHFSHLDAMVSWTEVISWSNGTGGRTILNSQTLIEVILVRWFVIKRSNLRGSESKYWHLPNKMHYPW